MNTAKWSADKHAAHLTALRRNVHEAEAQAQTAGRYAEAAQAAFYAAIEARERARAELRAALAEREDVA